MRLFTLLVLLFGIAQTSAYSIPGGYERVLFYYLYSIDCQLNGGTSKQIAPGCSRTKQPCTLDQFLRYIASNPNSLPEEKAPATSYPELPDMDDTAQKLSAKYENYDPERDFAGQIKTTTVLPGASGIYSTFLEQIGRVAFDFSNRSPNTAELLRNNLQAIRNTRRSAMLSTFKTANPSINVVSKPQTLYEGAPADLDVDVLDPAETLKQNPGLTGKKLNSRWLANTAGGHLENVEQLKATLTLFGYDCK